MQPRRPPLDNDARFVAALLAWEELFGQKPISWPELTSMGMHISAEEAEAHLSRGLADATRRETYRALLEGHPELQDLLDGELQKRIAAASDEVVSRIRAARSKKSDGKICHDFIARLSDSVRPHPEDELDHIATQAASAPSRSAWFATRKPGTAWRPAPNDQPAYCMVFHVTASGDLDVLLAEIVEHRNQRPVEAPINQPYPNDPEFRGWWRLAQPVRSRLPSLGAIPGHSQKGKTAAQAFAGQLSFAYWRFPQVPVQNLLPPAAPPSQLPP